MTITTRDQLVNALANNSELFVIDKASVGSTAAGQFFSLWIASGAPGTGATPSTAAVPTNATAGSLFFTNQTGPVTSYLGWLTLTLATGNQSLEIHDRLAHMGGLSGIVTTAQGALDLTVTNPGTARIGATNYSEVQWWLEWYVSTGGGAVNATVNVTYDDNSTGNLAVIALAATMRTSRLVPLVSAVAGRYIKAVNSVTLSATTGTAGNFGITATRQRTLTSAFVANKGENYDWAQLGLPEIPNNSCLMLVMNCATTTIGAVRAQGKIIHG